MSLFELSPTAITDLKPVDFAVLGLLERSDLQRLIRDHVDVISPDTLIIAEEFSSWDRSARRIDLLGIDRQARLVVIELKRTTDDSFADLQALRYAAMVSQMTFEEAVETCGTYLKQRHREDDPRESLLTFLGWDDPSSGRFGEDVRIVLAAADFNPEVTSTVLWLNERELDITCVRIQPYRLGTSVLLDVQQIIPLPEAASYTVQIRQKQRENRGTGGQVMDWTRYDVQTGDELHRALYKNQAVFVAVRYLVDQGVTPEDIEATANRKVFETMEGRVDGDTFRAELIRQHPNDPNIVKRYFSGDDQLLFSGDRTYVVTTQWSKPTMGPVMSALTAKYGSRGLSYQPSQANGTGLAAGTLGLGSSDAPPMRQDVITPERIDELLRFLPLLDQPDQEFIEKWGGGDKRPDGVVTLPYPVYPPAVEEFFRLASQSWWYDRQYDAEAGEMLKDDTKVRSATIDQIKTMLTWCVRGERFCDGHWGAVLRSGRVTALLRRLQELRASMESNTRP
jgi:hypothetical protein